MAFDLDSALENEVAFDKEGVSTQGFDLESALIKEEPPRKAGAFSKFLRVLTRGSVIDQMNRQFEILEGIESGRIPSTEPKRPDETPKQFRERFMATTGKGIREVVEEREERIASEGVLRQLEGPMTVAIGAGAIAAPVPTVIGVTAFTALDFIFNAREAIEEHAPDTNPNIKDIAETADLILKGAIIGGAFRVAPTAKAKIKAKFSETKGKIIDAIKTFKPVRINPAQFIKILESKNLTKAQKTEVLNTLGVKQEHLDVAMKKEINVKVPMEKVVDLAQNKKVWTKVKEDIGVKPTEPAVEVPKPAESPLVEAFKAKQKEVTERSVRMIKDTQRADAIRKGRAMERSATIRKLKGEPTAKEISREIDRLDAFSIGKEVKTPDGVGKIASRPAFGRFKVEIKGETKSFETADITAVKKITKADAIASLREKAEVEARAFLKQQGVKGEFENIVAEVEPIPEVIPVEKASDIIPKFDPKAKTIEGTGEVKVRKLAEGVEEKAVEKGLTEGFGELPAFKQLSMADQAARATKLIRENPELATEIAMGRQTAPKGLAPEAVFVAVEKKATLEGNVGVLDALAKESFLTAEATTMGQRIRTLGERDPESPVGAIKEVQKARETKVKKGKAKTRQKREVKKVKDSIKKETPKVGEWESFIKGLEC